MNFLDKLNAVCHSKQSVTLTFNVGAEKPTTKVGLLTEVFNCHEEAVAITFQESGKDVKKTIPLIHIFDYQFE